MSLLFKLIADAQTIPLLLNSMRLNLFLLTQFKFGIVSATL